MNIDKILAIGKIYKTESSSGTQKNRNSHRSDQVSLSNEALQKFEEAKLREIINKTPEIRADRVAEVKRKIEQNPNYFNELPKQAYEIVASKLYNTLNIRF